MTEPAPAAGMTRGGEKKHLFVAVFLLYALSSAGDLTGDSEVRWAVAKRIAQSGWVNLPAGSTRLAAEGRDGNWYTFYGPGQSVCFVPFVAAGHFLSALPLPGADSADMLGQFLASLVFFPLCGAAAVVLVYAIVRDAGGDARAARLTALIMAVATMHWHHTVNTYEESQVAVCVLGSLWAIQRAWRRAGVAYLILAFAAMGVGLSFRASSVVVFAPIGLVGFCRDLIGRCGRGEKLRCSGRWLSAAVVGLAPFVAALAAYNVARFGSVWRTGYVQAHLAMGDGIRLFETPLRTGLAGMLLSPGKSFFLFNPVMVLGVLGFCGLWRRRRALSLIVAGVFLSTILFHAKYTFWSGDLAWGPRFLASVTGICVLAVTPTLSRPRLRWVVVVVVVAVSVCVQLASVTYNFGLEFFQDRRHGTIPNGYVWRPAESQLFCRFRNIALDAAGRPIRQSIPPQREEPAIHKVITTPEAVMRLHVANVFPFKARANTGNMALFHCLLGLWLAGLAGLGVWVCRWYIRTMTPKNADETDAGPTG